MFVDHVLVGILAEMRGEEILADEHAQHVEFLAEELHDFVRRLPVNGTEALDRKPDSSFEERRNTRRHRPGKQRANCDRRAGPDLDGAGRPRGEAVAARGDGWRDRLGRATVVGVLALRYRLVRA